MKFNGELCEFETRNESCCCSVFESFFLRWKLFLRLWFIQRWGEMEAPGFIKGNLHPHASWKFTRESDNHKAHSAKAWNRTRNNFLQIRKAFGWGLWESTSSNYESTARMCQCSKWVKVASEAISTFLQKWARAFSLLVASRHCRCRCVRWNKRQKFFVSSLNKWKYMISLMARKEPFGPKAITIAPKLSASVKTNRGL